MYGVFELPKAVIIYFEVTNNNIEDTASRVPMLSQMRKVLDHAKATVIKATGPSQGPLLEQGKAMVAFIPAFGLIPRK